MSKLEVDKIDPQSGTNLELGTSGDTVTIPTGVTLDASNATTNLNYPLTNFSSTGIDDNATSTAMTIDSDGNLNIDTTTKLTDASISAGATGISLRGDADVALISRDGGYGLVLNRKTSDGTILELRKDGTEVGSIGTRGSNLYVGNDDVALKYSGSNDHIVPSTGVDGSGRNNAIDLGASGTAFKDLYLGGGLYVGGTGTANKLDDYEEGTFTPTLSGYAGTPTNVVGKYTKIGQIVFGALRFNLDGTSDGSHFQITSLPFGVGGTDNVYGGFVTYSTGTTNNVYILASDSGNNFSLYTDTGNALTYNSFGASAQIRIQFFYQVE